MRRILILSLILLSSNTFVFAQKPPSPEQMQKETEKMRREIDKIQQQELERLKKENPEAYQQRKDALDIQAKINEIVSSFRSGKISASQAESQLYPLVKSSLQDSINNLGAQIERLEKKLESLKKAKANPDLLVKKRIDELLGRSMPSPDDFLY
jgi:vacuolar-type H+-ATPase subunit I/STV1